MRKRKKPKVSPKTIDEIIVDTTRILEKKGINLSEEVKQALHEANEGGHGNAAPVRPNIGEL